MPRWSEISVLFTVSVIVRRTRNLTVNGGQWKCICRRARIYSLALSAVTTRNLVPNARSYEAPKTCKSLRPDYNAQELKRPPHNLYRDSEGISMRKAFSLPALFTLSVTFILGCSSVIFAQNRE